MNSPRPRQATLPPKIASLCEWFEEACSITPKDAEAEPAHASLGALLRDSFVEMDAEQFESSARDDDADEHGE